jgi:hypothetical protein
MTARWQRVRTMNYNRGGFGRDNGWPPSRNVFTPEEKTCEHVRLADTDILIF